MRTAEMTTAGLLALFSLYLMWISGAPPAWNPSAPRFANIGMIEGEGPGSGFWPFWLSFVMFLCCLWIGWNGWRRKSGPSRQEGPFLDAHSWRTVILVGGGVVGFWGLIYVLGFYGAIFVFMTYYMLVIGRHSLGLTLAIATALPVVSFFFFDVAMRIVLPKGYLEPLFIPLYAVFL